MFKCREIMRAKRNWKKRKTRNPADPNPDLMGIMVWQILVLSTANWMRCLKGCSSFFDLCHDMPLAGISDLPTKILVNILEDLIISTKTLYFLALLSQQLNYITLPLYCQQNSIDLHTNSARIILHANRPDLLSGLQICPWVSLMHWVECIFPHPSCTDIIPLSR
jgi:hypothetical protein